MAEEYELTPKEEIRALMFSLPFTMGGFWLLPYLEGVEKSGWVWWPALIGTLMAGAVSVVFGVRCAGRCIGRQFFNLFGLSFGEALGKSGEASSKFIAVIITAIFYALVGYIVFNAIDEVSKGEVAAFMIGGAVVYFVARRW